MADCCGPTCACWDTGGYTFTRRDFLAALAAGTLSLSAGCVLPKVEASRDLRLAPPSNFPEYPLTPPRLYQGDRLEAVAMPIGGIGTGTVWLDGQGRLSVWQIFNNFSETRVPDSFLAVRARVQGQEPVLRVLQTVAEEEFPAFESLTYEGGYPIARLRFRDPAFPLEVMLEGWNPMIPTDTERSSMPLAVFRVTAHNPTDAPAEFSALLSLQNAIGCEGAPPKTGRQHPYYKGNVNRVAQQERWMGVVMETDAARRESGPLVLRSPEGPRLDAPPMMWIESLLRMEDLTEDDERVTMVQILDHSLAAQGVAIVGGLGPELLEALRDFRTGPFASDRFTVFEDFETDHYGSWTVIGEAFGERPAEGALPGQHAVTGFFGRKLVNSFLPDDAAEGELISRPFTIERPYIGFVIGGGRQEADLGLQLRIQGAVVRTASGRNSEDLRPVAWDVSEFVGREAVIAIVDRRSGGWGHINVDQIVFSDSRPDLLLRLELPVQNLSRRTGLSFDTLETVRLPAPTRVVPRDPPLSGAPDWRIDTYLKVGNLQSHGAEPETLARLGNGDPILLRAHIGEADFLFSLAPGLPWSWAERLFLDYANVAPAGARLTSASPRHGSLAAGVVGSDETADATAAWTEAGALADAFLRTGRVEGPAKTPAPADGETHNGAVSATAILAPGETRTVTFAVAWHFPNIQRFSHAGNFYSTHYPSADAVLDAFASEAGPLWQKTALYHRTVYESNLPEPILDAFTSQCVIFRGPTCFRSEDGYFAGFEGCYGCCPLNCTHVWNYAQTHARLYPEIGRNLRRSDLITYLHESGETSHRQHGPHNAFIDGHCAVIVAALREAQLAPDNQFLEAIWPNLRKAVDWLIEAIDPDHDGVPAGLQWNTYDTPASGANTFIGSQYLAALAAGEVMARRMGAGRDADFWRAVREAGSANQSRLLWNGEYFIQIPGDEPGRDYNTGCHSDQLLGQWWAYQVNLGRLYPADRLRAAAAAIHRHNTRETFTGFLQAPRRYVIDEEGGLLMCTWPKGGRPDPFILYADEVWTGIEYATAGLLVYEGLMDEAVSLVRTARARYDGRRREGLNSGPGGNPFNELECGKFYARALASGSLLIASQGLILDGPAGVLGFKPNWQPAEHRSFFTVPEGWGLFVQVRDGTRQTQRIELRHGTFQLAELVFETAGDGPVSAEVQCGSETIPVHVAVARDGREVRLRLRRPRRLEEGDILNVRIGDQA